MNLGITCSCLMFTPAFLKHSRTAVRSLKSLHSSKSKSQSIIRLDSLENYGNLNSSDHTHAINETRKETWENETPDLQLLSEVHTRK